MSTPSTSQCPSLYQDFTTRQSGHGLFVLFSNCLRKKLLTKNSFSSFAPPSPSKVTSGLYLVGQNSDGNVTGAACRCLDQ